MRNYTKLRERLALEELARREKQQQELETAREEMESQNRHQSTEKVDWREWLPSRFPSYVRAGFATRHEEFWDWVWAIEKEGSADPFVAIWPRGGAKSTSAELATGILGALGKRKYALYICETQAQADNHVANIATILERLGIERGVTAYGTSKGWRRNRLVTNAGFTVDALGLDSASRGAKIDEDRPDLMVFDDIDGEHDTLAITDKKERTITNSILPAGFPYTAVLMIQNLIIPNGIFGRLCGKATKQADYLIDRRVSGPHPAVEGIITTQVQGPGGIIKTVIVGGLASWAGQSLAACQQFVDRWGWGAFDKEAQHNVGDKVGAIWTREMLTRTRVLKAPLHLDKIVVGVDPPGSVGRCGIVVCGSARVGGVVHGYTLEDASTEAGASPGTWSSAVIDAFHRWHADEIVVETNMGGAMVKNTLRLTAGGELARIVEVVASRGKRTRAEPISNAMEEGREHHAGTFPDLENMMCGWVPGDDSPDPMDAKVWALTRLLGGTVGESFSQNYDD